MRFKDFLIEAKPERDVVFTFLTEELYLDSNEFEIHSDLSVTLLYDLTIEVNKAQSRKRLPVKFREIKGSVWISNCMLETLIGLPEKIDGGIYLTNTRIKDLKFCPKTLGATEGDLVLQNNRNLVSLEGCPEKISGDFTLNDCHHITSLEHAPKEVGKTYKVEACNSLSSIQGLASTIGKHLMLRDNRSLKSLAGISKILKSVGGKLDVSGSRFTSSIMGLLLIKGFTGISYQFGPAEATKAFEIVFKCRDEGKDAIECQDALIDAGLSEFAKL